MTLIRHYAARTFTRYLLFFAYMGIFLLVFCLYKLPLLAFLYPFLLCLLLGTVVTCIRFLMAYQRHKRVTAMQKTIADVLTTDDFPVHSIEDEDDRALLSILCHVLREEKLQRHNQYKEMTEYYTTWVHQIKTPIASIRLRLDGEDTALARAIAVEVQRTEQYVEMVLVYLRMQGESAATDYVIDTCDIDAIVRDAAKKLSAQFIGKRIAFSMEASHLEILTDEKWLSFVVEQVLSNSLKYTHTGGTISVYTVDKMLCISDTSIGIAPTDLPRVFEHGFTGFHGREDKRATGIGLYLCKRICEKLGHTIELESEPGVGTTVKIGLSRFALHTE